ncbi:MAG: DUF2255 family protein [Candidatus Limnocylindrales bacterium]
MAFTADELRLIDRTEEVEIETTTGDGPTHRTIIWAIVDDDAVFIRSYRGPNARWYREALTHPAVALHVEGRRLAAAAIPARDPESIERTSQGFVRKYPGDPATPKMLRPEVRRLTLRLERA